MVKKIMAKKNTMNTETLLKEERKDVIEAEVAVIAPTKMVLTSKSRDS